MVKRIFISTIIALFAAFVANAQSGSMGNWVDVETIDGLKIIKPNFSSVDMAFGNESPKGDKSVIACFGAAFTGKYLEEFKHENIASDHAGGGKKYKGYVCKRNTGAFIYDGKSWKFLYKNKKYSSLLATAAKKGGCGFAQEMMIYNGTKVKTTRPKDNQNIFRALCERNGELVVIESLTSVRFGDFINSLLSKGVKHALYLDMGTWRYGWYRPNNTSFVELHTQIHNFHSNWLIFKK